MSKELEKIKQRYDELRNDYIHAWNTKMIKRTKQALGLFEFKYEEELDRIRDIQEEELYELCKGVVA